MSWIDSLRRLARRAREEERREAVVVFSSFFVAEAHLVKGLLESEGIAAEVRDQLAAYGEIPATPQNLPSVWVAARDAARADAVVRELQGGRVERGEAWRCEGCGETVGASFTACWRCGRSRTEQAGP